MSEILELKRQKHLHENLISWLKVSFTISVILPAAVLLAVQSGNYNMALSILLIILSLVSWLITLLLGYAVWKSRTLLLNRIHDMSQKKTQK